jgi:ABC-type uncharacterized transport system substrate-binding protein
VDELNRILFEDAIRSIDAKNYEGKRVIIKGCSDKEVPVSAYVELTHALLPYVKSIMYGEACSNVPIYKKKQL